MTTVPEVGRSRPARQCISVDLPDPDGPMIAVSAPAGKLDGDAVERGHRGLALAEHAAKVGGADDRLLAVCGGLVQHELLSGAGRRQCLPSRRSGSIGDLPDGDPRASLRVQFAGVRAPTGGRRRSRLHGRGSSWAWPRVPAAADAGEVDDVVLDRGLVAVGEPGDHGGDDLRLRARDAESTPGPGRPRRPPRPAARAGRGSRSRRRSRRRRSPRLAAARARSATRARAASRAARRRVRRAPRCSAARCAPAARSGAVDPRIGGAVSAGPGGSAAGGGSPRPRRGVGRSPVVVVRRGSAGPRSSAPRSALRSDPQPANRRPRAPATATACLPLIGVAAFSRRSERPIASAAFHTLDSR